MFQAKRQPFDWVFVLIVADIIVIAVSGVVARCFFSVTHMDHQGPPFSHRIGYGIFIVCVMYWIGLYRWKYFIWVTKSFVVIAAALAIALIVFLGIGNFFNSYVPPFVPPRWVLVHYCILVLLLCLERTLMHVMLVNVLKLLPIARIAFIGDSIILWKVLQNFVAGMGKSKEILGFIESEECKNPPRFPALREYRCLGNLRDLQEIIQRENVSFMLVDTRSVSAQRLLEIRTICSRFFINLQVIPILCDLWPNRLELHVVGGAPVYGFGNLTLDFFYVRIYKRLFALVVGSIGLLISIPIIAVLAILIKRESPGPAFFRQTRLGLYKKPFKIIKLRSMRMDAEEKTGPVRATKDDPRRLKIGAFMRKWNLDELPQFWNVIKGEMNVVGPRPERPELAYEFEDLLAHYNLRHSCKPGVTGWAAIHGLRGDTSLKDRISYDLYYIENWTPWMDIYIILMTLVPSKNAY